MDTKQKSKGKKRKAVKTKAASPEINAEDMGINVDIVEIVEEKMTPRQAVVVGPVPLEKHYEIFKSVENRVRARLSELTHEYYLTGLRVAYDEQDSSNEPDVLPYSVEFGQLGLLDVVLKHGEPEEISDEDLKKLSQKAPIPVDFLDELYDSAKDKFEQNPLDPKEKLALSIGVYIVLNGSSSQIYGRDCKCRGGSSTLLSGYKRRTILAPFTGMAPRTYCGPGC